MSDGSPDRGRRPADVIADAGRGPTRFVVDAMLGSFARKLRIFGFDALYFGSGPDAELLQVAKADRRIILTSDRMLWEDAIARKRVPAFLVQGKNDRARLVSLLTAARG